jgi:hypothetical protein
MTAATAATAAARLTTADEMRRRLVAPALDAVCAEILARLDANITQKKWVVRYPVSDFLRASGMVNAIAIRLRQLGYRVVLVDETEDAFASFECETEAQRANAIDVSLPPVTPEQAMTVPVDTTTTTPSSSQ